FLVSNPPPPPGPSLFPYTTLFRSSVVVQRVAHPQSQRTIAGCRQGAIGCRQLGGVHADLRGAGRRPTQIDAFTSQSQGAVAGDRSEEHTSELQSRENLVCRLLLEK